MESECPDKKYLTGWYYAGTDLPHLHLLTPSLHSKVQCRAFHGSEVQYSTVQCSTVDDMIYRNLPPHIVQMVSNSHITTQHNTTQQSQSVRVSVSQCICQYISQSASVSELPLPWPAVSSGTRGPLGSLWSTGTRGARTRR